jgi:hypothetical protein
MHPLRYGTVPHILPTGTADYLSYNGGTRTAPIYLNMYFDTSGNTYQYLITVFLYKTNIK